MRRQRRAAPLGRAGTKPLGLWVARSRPPGPRRPPLDAARLCDALAVIGRAALSPELLRRVRHWDELDDAEREATVRDLDMLAKALTGS